MLRHKRQILIIVKSTRDKTAARVVRRKLYFINAYANELRERSTKKRGAILILSFSKNLKINQSYIYIHNIKVRSKLVWIILNPLELHICLIWVSYMYYPPDQ